MGLLGIIVLGINVYSQKQSSPMIILDVDFTDILDIIHDEHHHFQLLHLNSLDYPKFRTLDIYYLLYTLHGVGYRSEMIEHIADLYYHGDSHPATQFYDNCQARILSYLQPYFNYPLRTLDSLRFCKGYDGSITSITYMTADEWDDKSQGMFGVSGLCPFPKLPRAYPYEEDEL